MNRHSDRKEVEGVEKAPRNENAVVREHAGNKPRLTDEQAHAELRRRQREREGRR